MMSQKVCCLEKKREEIFRVLGRKCVGDKSIHEDVTSGDKRLRVQNIRRARVVIRTAGASSPEMMACLMKFTEEKVGNKYC